MAKKHTLAELEAELLTWEIWRAKRNDYSRAKAAERRKANYKKRGVPPRPYRKHLSDT